MPLPFENPRCLALLVLMAVPWWSRGAAVAGYSWIALLPRDPASTLLDRALKLLASVAIGGCVLGLAQPYRVETSSLHVGRGAQIVVLLDRSRSMDESFAGATSAGTVMSERPVGTRESKGSAARRQLAEFARRRPHDLYAMLDFTNIPIPIMGFTPQPEMVQAAIRAGNEGRGLAATDVGLGLLAALDQFAGQPYNGSRVILLVSDGGSQLDADMQRRITLGMQRQRVALYWLYLRTPRSRGLLADQEVAADAADQVPEHFLHRFFSGMGIPYHAYEAEDPTALERAVNDVDRLEKLPIRYEVPAQRRSLAAVSYAVSLVCTLLLLVVRVVEV